MSLPRNDRQPTSGVRQRISVVRVARAIDFGERRTLKLAGAGYRSD
jgi:hypothetical protein